MRDGRKKLRVICGAKNRRGEPCKCKLRLKGGKCKFHGGMSTGPRTPEGKARAIEAGTRNLKAWNERRRISGISGISSKPTQFPREP